MNRPPIEKIRRAALAVAVTLTLILAATYGWRRWQAYRAQRQATPMAPGVRQQTEEFSFSGTEGVRTLFTVHASRTVERAGRLTVLDDVRVTVFGRRGDRADEIRTGRCEYDLGGTGLIGCPGRVSVRLGANRAASIVLTTAGVEFDTAKGEARTAAPVEFEFPGGTGSAIGLRYRPEEPRVRLEKDISIRVRRGGGAPVEIRGVALDYLAGAQAFELAAPLEVRVGDRALTAQRLRMELTQDYRTRRLEASGNAQMRVGQTGGPALLRAASAVAEYGASGRMEQVRAAGGVSFERRGPAAEEQLNCDEAVFLLDAAGKEIERAVARGHPRLISRRGVDTRELQAPVLELTVRPGGDRLVAPERGTLTLRGRPGDESNVTADRLELEFGAGRRLERLSAAGHVETRDFRAGKPLRTTGSDELRARFDAAGKVAEAHQTGRFRYAEDRRRAEAGRAEFAAALQTYTLREDPVVWDATSRTTARVITVNDTAGVFEAEGDVRTTRQPVAGSAGFDPTQPMNIAADRLRAENERGWARYEGRARLWQGENRLAAQVMEWLRSPGRLVAAGDVSGLFLERDRDGRSAERRAVEITSARFTYWESERRGEFDERVIARNDFGVLTAPHLEVFLASGEDRLERAHAVGGVGIERDGRRAVSDEAEYRAGEQTVVLWGGTPRISDPARGVTTGDRLTLSLADGTISVDSNERTRTLTRPPTTQ